ncbi:hypothetical protein HNQ59_002897 [Chitinivorax tropicus]|uniref:Uncharacterized protein n=1 Tax=Chitinivorax tropicus TaxID=714531 RepID=A0A840MQ77_9PROT|nr:hypothetical protein [Chitinivorax tropicus]MBB5019595.1 hypothetical protein [Chitinivorax tropicus]
MSMTFWIQTLENGQFNEDSDDDSLMFDYCDDLDELCDELGVAKLSSFSDQTDMEYNLADDFSDEEDDEPDDDDGYQVDDMEWFDADAGLLTLKALHDHLQSHPQDWLAASQQRMLLDELSDCIDVLDNLSGANGKFHLAVIL